MPPGIGGIFLRIARLLTSKRMQKNTLVFVLVAALGGFIGGFWLANSLNRSAGTTAPAPIANSNSANTPDTELTDAEIRAKIAEADRNPANLAFQRDLGVSLYRYAAMKQDVGLLGESARVLERAAILDSKDLNVLVALGNAHFDIGFYQKDAASFQKARDVYSQALKLRPADPDVITDFGLTYFLQEPPDYPKALKELEKVGSIAPSHDRSLQLMVRVYLKQNDVAEAEKVFAKLKAINPSNSAIPELTSLIETQRGAGK